MDHQITSEICRFSLVFSSYFTKLAGSNSSSRTDLNHQAVPGPVPELSKIVWRFRVSFCNIFAHGSGTRVPRNTRAQHCLLLILHNAVNLDLGHQKRKPPKPKSASKWALSNLAWFYLPTNCPLQCNVWPNGFCPLNYASHS